VTVFFVQIYTLHPFSSNINTSPFLSTYPSLLTNPTLTHSTLEGATVEDFLLPVCVNFANVLSRVLLIHGVLATPTWAKAWYNNPAYI
jgi:hypothetical protein